MANKKIMMSVTASAAIAAAIFGAEEASASSHKVQSGDTLWGIAQKSGTSVATLRSLNSLTSDIIHPNQVIRTASSSSNSSSASSSSSSSNSDSGSSSNSSSANTYKVKAGDTLSGIASRHGISLQNLMKWNDLDTTLIFPGNVFKVSNSGSSSSGSSSSGSSSSSSSSNSGSTGSSSGSSASASVYTVKSGDTLSRIASQHGVSVSSLKSTNNLRSDLILIGQKLNIGGSSSSTPANSSSSSSSKSSSDSSNASVDYNVNQLVSTAKSQIGTPYVWGGTSTSGFDCSGFIHYAYKQAGKNISRLSTDGYFDRSFYVNSPQVGDLVFFSGTYRSGISHMGIYIGNNQFIHAGSSIGVTVTSLSNPYWSKHFDSYKRFY